MASPPVDNERRLKVMHMYTTGMNAEEIAKALNLTTRTIFKDLAARRKQLEKSEKKEDMWKKIAQLNENQRQRVKRLWNIATDPAASRKEKMRALDLLHKEDELFIKRGQIAGILPKDAPLVAIQNNTKIELSINEEFKEFQVLLDQNKK